MKKTCCLATLVITGLLFLLHAPAIADNTNWVRVSGTVTYRGEPVCAMVLTNGQYMFTSPNDGKFEISAPLNNDGQLTVFSFCSGLAPFKQVIDPSAGANFTIALETASDGSGLDVSYTFEEKEPNRVQIEGRISLGGIPVCALVLANGQYMFSCSGDGSFQLNVPIDGNGEVTLYGFADGRPPYKTVFKADGYLTEEIGGVVGTNGGTLTVPAGSPYLAGTELTVPAGALDQDTDLVIQSEAANAESSPPIEVARDGGQLYLALVDYAMQHIDDGYLHPMYSPLIMLMSASFSGPAVHLGPDKLAFNTPATLSIPFACLDITAADETLMPLLRSSDGTWEIPADFSSSGADGVAVADIPHFSIMRYIKNFASFAWNAFDVQDSLESAQAIIPQDTLNQSVIAAVCSGTALQTGLSDMPDETELLLDLFIGATPGATPADTDKLENWILDQQGKVAANSISLAQLFAEALSQQNGNLYKALAATHGLLSLDRGKAYLNELIEKPRKDSGDQSGARYHFFGAALHAFVHEYQYEQRNRVTNFVLDQANINQLLDPESILTIEEGIISGDIVQDTVEYAVDLKGAEFGRELYRQVQGNTLDEVIAAFGIDVSTVCDEGITWMADSGSKMTWDAANQYCLNNGGRLPTSLELRQAWLDGGSLLYPVHTPGFNNWLYWGESHPTGTMADTFLFSYGMLSGKSKNEEAFVRCVQ